MSATCGDRPRSQDVGERGEVGLDTLDLADRQSLRAMLLEPARPLVKEAPTPSVEPGSAHALAH